MPFSDDQKRRFLINLRVPVIIFLLWAILPADLYLHLYYVVHILIMSALLPLTIYAGLALREQGKRRLSLLAFGTSVGIVILIAIIRHLDAKLMGTGIWF